MTDTNIEKVWILTSPDSGKYSESGMRDAMAAVSERMSGFWYIDTGRYRDTGFGQEELFELVGSPSEIEDFLYDIYGWAADITADKKR